MSENVIRIMAGLERRLDTYTGKAVSSCGFDSALDEVERYRKKMLTWLASEIEKLEEKAGDQ